MKTKLNIAAAEKRCKAGLPTMGWTSSGSRYLTGNGHAYICQLEEDCAAALEALGKLEVLQEVARLAKILLNNHWGLFPIGSGEDASNLDAALVALAHYEIREESE